MSKRTRNSRARTELPIDALTIVVGLLDTFDRARFRLVCHHWRAAVRARREHLYWYCYRRAWHCMHPECPHKGFCADGRALSLMRRDEFREREPSQWSPSQPAIFIIGLCAYAMRVLPARLEMRDADSRCVIVCESGHWAGTYSLTENRLYHEVGVTGYRPQDRSHWGDPPDYDWKHCRFMYLPINA